MFPLFLTHPPQLPPSSEAQVAVVELPFGFVSNDNIGGAGGTCVIRGCVPKKLLVYASEFREAFEDALGFGWQSGIPPHDLSTLIQRKGAEIERLNMVYKSILAKSGVDCYEGRGVILDPHTVEVRSADGSVRRLRARNILIATGGHAVKIPIPGAEYGITSDEALVMDQLPQKGEPLVIIGGGYIGVEFAGIFNGLGADVHIMYRGAEPLRGFDGECRGVLAENLRARGVKVHGDSTPTAIEKDPSTGKLTLYFKDRHDQEHSLQAAKIMFATGRRPSSKNIGLEDVGVKMHERSRAILVDEYSRTNIPSIFAIGDVTDRMALTPVALMEGKALAATLFGGKPTKPDYNYIPTAVFSQPPMATVGYTEELATKEVAGDIDVYVSKFRPMKNTLSGRDERTFMKMLVHCQTNKVIGCHMVGPDAGEIMQGLAIALKCGATKAQFDSTVGIHPSAAEEWVTMSGPPTRKIKGLGRKEDGTAAHMDT